jgi:hypothetical protein
MALEKTGIQACGRRIGRPGLGHIPISPVYQDLGGVLHGQFCKSPVLAEISRTEISTSPSLTTWKSTRGCPSYVTSRCDGVTQYIQRCMLSGTDFPS